MNSRRKFWAGIVLSGLCAMFLIADSAMKLMNIAPVREAVARLGYPDNTTLPIGITLLVCTILYLIPPTAVLGAILLTGYLGGATATHVRVGEPFYFPILFGVLIWAGLFLREPRLGALIPVVQFKMRS